MKLTLKELELLNTASAYNGEQHKAICGKAALELIEYKKIEEELGIDLITLLKALKNGYYVKEETGIYEVLPGNINDVDLIRKCIISQHGFTYFVSLFKDYGKTWALDKSDLTSE